MSALYRNTVNVLYTSAVLLLTAITPVQAQKTAQKPNIVYILSDDLGYGDVKYFNHEGKIATPNIDKLGSQGMAFTDVHSSSSVCTPSRYSILTGRYNWRTRLSKGVLSGYDAPLIDSNRLTVAKYLQQKGYYTACIGKWHLGLGWSITTPGVKPIIDYTKNIEGGPNTRGFDYFYGIAASLDMPPFIYIENNHTVGLPTATKKWVREGPAEPNFETVNAVPDFTHKAVQYIGDHSKTGKPFFLYFTLPSPHTPIVPSADFKGKSGVTDYGDYVEETDWAVGEIMKAIEANHIAKNTILIFASDNGFAPYVLKTFNVEAMGHMPSYHFRGYKSDIWEGGHRIPFIVRWPGKVAPGSSCDKTVCLGDFMATTAAIMGDKLPDNAAEDSYNILPYLTGTSGKTIIRDAIVNHSIDGYFAIRRGNWKLELCPGSGGWESPKNGEAYKAKMPPMQLYNLAADIKEQNNVYAQHPDIVKNLTALLQKYVNDGRSTPGKPQHNDADVDLWKKNYVGGGDATKNGD